MGMNRIMSDTTDYFLLIVSALSIIFSIRLNHFTNSKQNPNFTIPSFIEYEKSHPLLNTKSGIIQTYQGKIEYCFSENSDKNIVSVS